MPKASEIANELRKVVALLEKNPDNELSAVRLSWYEHTREAFLAAVPFIPKPAKKRVDTDTSYPYFHLEYATPACNVSVNAPQNVTCTLVTPAKAAVYDCVPLLSQEDEEVMA